MKSQSIFARIFFATAIAVSASWANSAPQESSTAEDFQVLTSGPVHEAFAEAVAFDPQPGMKIKKAPPAQIEELPPRQKPDGDNIAWISGYWSWDDGRDDFVWVSGVWRALPPGRQWIPGYWSSSGEAFQWVSGYWADATDVEVEYLPAPPVSVEAGPNTVAPTVDHIWTPGCWVWSDNRYLWRPGYWLPAQENWVWVPAHYACSPQGHVFIDGYYDHAVARRGVLFAPIYFQHDVYSRQDFHYRPSIAIGLAVFASQLFLRPNHHQYYFGDYYGSNYSSRGFCPSFSYTSRGHGYDPFFAHQRWQNRRNPGWVNDLHKDYQYRVDHEDARPPRTWAAQQALLKSSSAPNIKNLVVASAIENLTQLPDNTLRLRPLTKEEQQNLGKARKEVNLFREDRKRLEAQEPLLSTQKPPGTAKPSRVKLPKSPLVASLEEPLTENRRPPKRIDPPALDSKAVAPKGPKTSPKIELDPKPTPKVEPKTDPRVEPKPAPKVDPKPAPRVDPKPAPRVEPKPAPRVEPKPAPKVDPKPAPRVDPKPAPRVEPKPAPRVEPKPAPKVDPKPAPRAEPKAVPRGEPKAPKGAPKSEPKRGPKGEPK